MIVRHRQRFLLGIALMTGLAVPLSCFTSPETCHQCGSAFDAAPGPDGLGIGGGRGAVGSGGIISSGGSSGAGGAPATGSAGAPAMGGAPATGGAPAMGGAPSTGGAPAMGGAPSTGGLPAAGGASGRGGAAGGSGGITATGGAAMGGAPATGGVPATGGTTSTGGAGGRGGASSGGGAGGATAGAGGKTDPDLVLWYKLDETSGTTAVDSAVFGGTARNGTITTASTGTATFSTTAKIGTHALALGGSSATAGAYLSLPSLQALAPSAVTIACWVYVTKDQVWQRVFDIGRAATPPASYMFLTTHQAGPPASVRFAITTMGPAEQQINMTTPAVPTSNAWHHLAVTLAAGSPYTGTLYIDHAVAGTNTAMTLHPSDLGATDQNTIGKSLYTVDPYLGAIVDDFRIYRRALTAAEIAALP